MKNRLLNPKPDKLEITNIKKQNTNKFQLLKLQKPNQLLHRDTNYMSSLALPHVALALAMA